MTVAQPASRPNNAAAAHRRILKKDMGKEVIRLGRHLVFDIVILAGSAAVAGLYGLAGLDELDELDPF